MESASGHKAAAVPLFSHHLYLLLFSVHHASDSRTRKDQNRVIVGVPKESYPGERRVSLVPMVIPNLTKAGFEVVVESCAGEAAGYPDAAYTDKGAKILPDRAAVFGAADVVVQVLCYGSNDVTGKADLPLFLRRPRLIGFLPPLGSVAGVQQITD